MHLLPGSHASSRTIANYYASSVPPCRGVTALVNIGKHLKLIAASILCGVIILVEVDYTLCYFFFMSSVVYLQLYLEHYVSTLLGAS